MNANRIFLAFFLIIFYVPLVASEKAFASADISGAWRFKMMCGQIEYRGFFSLKTPSPQKAEALFEVMINTHNVGMLNTAGNYNKSSNELALKSAGFIPGAGQFGPFDFTLRVNDKRNEITGTAQGSAQCSALKAWKTTIDTQRNPAGIIASRADALTRVADVRNIFQTKPLTSQECVSLMQWHIDTTVINTPDGAVSSAFADAEKMRNVLGFAYDEFTDIDSRAYATASRNCSRLLSQSPDTTHAALINQYNNHFRNVPAGFTPYTIGNSGPKIRKTSNNSFRVNPDWYRNMYIATSIRDARAYKNDLIRQIETKNNSPEKLKILASALQESQSKSGWFAYLSESELKSVSSHLDELYSKQYKSLVNVTLDEIPWSDYQPTLDGLKALKEKQDEIENSLRSSLPDSGMKYVADQFDIKRAPPSKTLTDNIISSYPGVDISLQGLRSYRSDKERYYESHQEYLHPDDKKRLLDHFTSSLNESLLKSSGHFSLWLEQEVPGGSDGVSALNQISLDLLGVPVDQINGSNYPSNLKFVADALLSHSNKVKVEACVVPEGFEDMKDVVCQKS